MSTTPSSPDDIIRPYAHFLGQVPDYVLAAEIGLSAEDIRSYRRRHVQIVPAPEPAAVEEPPAEEPVAEEPVAEALPAEEPVPEAAAAPEVELAGVAAWRLTIRTEAGEVVRFALADDPVDPCRRAEALGRVVHLERIGEGLT